MTATYTTPGFYVLDEMCPLGIEEAIIAGPFFSYGAAELERESLNVADDCAVYRLDKAANVASRH